MPAIDLDQGPQKLSRYDVVGKRAERQTSFVTHVGLYDADNQFVKTGDAVSTVHMRPPLEQGKTIKVHVAGHVPFTNDEIKEISVWIAEIIDEYHKENIGPERQYIIHPPWEDEYDLNTGVRRYRRYSCAGFVLDGHHQVHIELVQIDEDSLPDVKLSIIISAYPVAERHSIVRGRYGLKGDGPWKVLLPGYVLHALSRPTDQIRQEPYRAKQGDELF
jgi:hypothetical protein